MDIGEFVISHESAIRLGFFFGILAAMSLWELAAPRRMLTVPKLLRWVNNIGIVVINSVLLRRQRRDKEGSPLDRLSENTSLQDRKKGHIL